jgi:hypothetical protein
MIPYLKVGNNLTRLSDGSFGIFRVRALEKGQVRMGRKV